LEEDLDKGAESPSGDVSNALSDASDLDLSYLALIVPFLS
jgi:hypothetical protein